MSPFQFGAGLVVLAGAILALSARDTRLVLGGLVATLGLAPVIAEPIPSPIAIAARFLAALLGAELLLVVLRRSAGRTRSAGLGPLSTALAAAAACVVGYTTSGVGAPALGPPVATAIGFGLATLALGPLLLGRDVLRIGLGMALLVTAAQLIRTGLAGTPGSLEQVVSAGLTVALLGTTAAIAASALAAGHDLSVEPMAPRETLFEAHPLATSAADRGRRTPADRGADAARAGRGQDSSRHGRGPAARPRRDVAAHQLTLEERLRLATPPESGDQPEPAAALPGAATVPIAPAAAEDGLALPERTAGPAAAAEDTSAPAGGDQPG